MAQTGFYCPHCQTQRLFTAQEMNHTPHILASVFLCGLWLPMWLLTAALYKSYYHCSQCGFSDAARYLANPNLRAEEQQVRAYREANPSPGGWFSNPQNVLKIGAAAAVGVLLLIVISLSISKNGSNVRTDSNTDQKPVLAKEPYENFTFNTTYGDALKLMGKPDKEVNTKPPEAKIPNTMAAFTKQNIVMFFAYDMPFNGKFDKSKSHYLGTKGFNPEKVVHSVDERSRILLDAYKFTKP